MTTSPTRSGAGRAVTRRRAAALRPSVLLLLILAAVLASALPAAASGNDFGHVRAAVARYHRVEAAVAAGWDFVPGLDHCFTNPGVGAMGWHLINTDLLDHDLDPSMPEALVYVPMDNGGMRLGAVEYIVPAASWDAENDEPPMVLDQHLHLNPTLGVYVLHAWLFEPNPAGMLEDWNPRVSCPTP